MGSASDVTARIQPPIEPAPLWRKLVSVAIAVCLLGWGLSQVDFRSFLSRLAGINHVAYVGFMLVFVLALLVADAAAIRHVYSRYVCKVEFSEIIALRGASYLPSLINYHVGQAWLTWYVSKTYGARVARVTGATLLNYATIFASLGILGALAYPFGQKSIPWLGQTLVALGLGALGYAIVVVAKPKFLLKIPGFDTLFDAGVRGHLMALLWRFPHVVILFLGMWLPFGFFNVRIPMGDALAYIPILMLVGALPITPQGVGTRDVIALSLLSSYAPSSNQSGSITAATFCWAVTITLVEGLISPLFYILVRRLLNSARAPART